MLQAAVLLLEKLTAKQASHVPSVPPSPPKAPVDRQYDSTGVGWGGGERRVWPHTISSLCLQERQCVNLNEELVSNEEEA